MLAVLAALLCGACAHRRAALPVPCVQAARQSTPLYLAQAVVWHFPTHRAVRVYYLVSDPTPDVMGFIYFRAGRVALVWSYPTTFASADEAVRAARCEGYEVMR